MVDDFYSRRIVSGKTVRFRGFVTEDGTAKDLTGDRIRVAVYSPANQNIVFQKDSNQEQVVLQEDGVYRWTIDPTDTANLTREVYEYEIQLDDTSSGDRVPLELGEFRIKHTPL